MADITAALVKELRDKSGAGMMDCKGALVEAKGDLDKAIRFSRLAIKYSQKSGGH